RIYADSCAGTGSGSSAPAFLGERRFDGAVAGSLACHTKRLLDNVTLAASTLRRGREPDNRSLSGQHHPGLRTEDPFRDLTRLVRLRPGFVPVARARTDAMPVGLSHQKDRRVAPQVRPLQRQLEPLANVLDWLLQASLARAELCT